jgi:hypothetical protein
LDSFKDKKFEELWSGEIVKGFEKIFETEIAIHGAKLYKIQDICGMSVGGFKGEYGVNAIRYLTNVPI